MAARWVQIVAALVVFALSMSDAATADDFYYQAVVQDLKFADGATAPAWPEPTWQLRGVAEFRSPYVVLDGPGEAYVAGGRTYGTWRDNGPPKVYIRSEQKGDVSGRLFWPKADWSGMTVLRFTLPAGKATAGDRGGFLGAKAGHYHRLLSRDLPGAAWFRHEMRQADAARGNRDDIRGGASPPTGGAVDTARLSRTYDLFSGGRAVSENLQLDRQLQSSKPEEATEDIGKITGITVAEIDWKPLIKNLQPKLDPLAALIPADQHAVFFPTFSAAAEAVDQAERQGTPVLYLAEPRSEDAGVKERYQRQLGLSLSGLGRLLGPHVARSVAATGSDLYFRTGTDVAVVFETPNPALLENLLMAQIAMSATKQPGAKPEQGEIGGLRYRGVRSADRRICSYVAALDGAVIVTNSLYQIERFAAVVQKKTPNIASLPEYVFFRDRYRLGDPEETAFVFLSDATIRRWCGPRWRIATSRQTRDLGVLAELQAANMDRLAKREVEPGPIYTDFATADVGQLRLGVDGVWSSVQGSLDFMTPIAEIPLRKVTKAEATAYGWWRDGYQRNWRWAFDPIGIRLTLKKNHLAADTTIMPLIWNTQYRNFLSLTQDGCFASDAGDPHDALLHFIMALNVKSPSVASAENFVSTMARGATLGWIGSYVTVYADEDPLWKKLAETPPEKLGKFLEENAWRLPVGVQVGVSNGLKLAAFLTSWRAYIDQTAPGMARWESLIYRDQPYVKVTQTEKEKTKGLEKMLEKMAIYYAPSGDALVVTLNENLLKRVIDRRLARDPKKSAGLEPAGPVAMKNDGRGNAAVATPAWLGSNVALRVERPVWELLGRLNRDEHQRAMQICAWSNLPILNEWHRRYPDQDPVAVHERVWKIKLLCPGGGRYVWNEKYQTMESTVYGNPGQPKPGPDAPPILLDFARGAFGLTFENQGLRARVSLERDEKQ